MTERNPTRSWRLVEVWGDTVDTRHLAWSIAIGLGVSLAGFLIARRLLVSAVATPELARAYAMLAGLAGCVLSGVICARIFPPKREVVEGDAVVDPAWRLEVLARLDEEHGGLGKLADLPPVVMAEMKELGLYELFAAHEKNAPAPGRRVPARPNGALANREATTTALVDLLLRQRLVGFVGPGGGNAAPGFSVAEPHISRGAAKVCFADLDALIEERLSAVLRPAQI